MNYEVRVAKIIGEIVNQPTEIIMRFLKEANKNIDADFAINCFALKKALKKNGPEIAAEIKEKFTDQIMQENAFVEEITATGPYVNIKLNKTIIGQQTIAQIFEDIDTFAISDFNSKYKTKKIVVEYPSPNTNKPLHLGHVRNMLLGQAISVLNEYVKNQVFQVNLLNDRGVHICKSMWAYKTFGNNTTPKSENRKSDHFVGDYYVRFAQEESKLKSKIKDKTDALEKEMKKPKEERDTKLIDQYNHEINESDYGKLQATVKDMLVKWENKDPETRKLWRKMNDWAEKGYHQTFETFKIKHNKTYYESNIYDKGKDIVLNGLKNGIFEKLEDGAVVAKFKKKGLPKQKVLLRKDGTTLYVTQDLFLANEKMKDFNYDQSVYVVGNEQDMQLRTVFELLRKLGMKADNIHYSYGMINLTTGKMKSREGTVVDADDLIEELIELALKEISKRYSSLDEKELKIRANKIAMAALRFFVLKYEYTRDFLFDPEKSISFEGETGPYILYAYARICSIFKKALEQGIQSPFDPQTNKRTDQIKLSDVDLSVLKDEHENKLVEFLVKYPKIITESAKNMRPHVISRYLYELAQEYNAFYHKCRIIGEEDKVRDARMILSEAIRTILLSGLSLLQIEVINEM